ncbi:MAG: CvpA family protein [Bacteroidales bacterium]|jgi:membrane protein required for colicin V production|nr:CvpA family protein [Bacteroidales bacterium]MDD4395045.1 CvpA family protein [Bacteroidales bacterium]
MNFLDFLIILPLLWFGYKGFKNGLIKELFSLAALILGIYITYKFSDFITSILPPSEYAPMIAFIIIFIGVLIGVNLVGRLAEKTIKLVIPNIINQILGIAFGVAKVTLVCSILLHFIKTIDKKEVILQSDVIHDSLLYGYIEQSTDFIVNWADVQNINLEDEFEANPSSDEPSNTDK